MFYILKLQKLFESPELMCFRVPQNTGSLAKQFCWLKITGCSTPWLPDFLVWEAMPYGARSFAIAGVLVRTAYFEKDRVVEFARMLEDIRIREEQPVSEFGDTGNTTMLFFSDVFALDTSTVIDGGDRR